MRPDQTERVDLGMAVVESRVGASGWIYTVIGHGELRAVKTSRHTRTVTLAGEEIATLTWAPRWGEDGWRLNGSERDEDQWLPSVETGAKRAARRWLDKNRTETGHQEADDVKRTKYTDEDRRKHVEGTEGMGGSALAIYAKREGVAVSTLRAWSNAAASTARAKAVLTGEIPYQAVGYVPPEMAEEPKPKPEPKQVENGAARLGEEFRRARDHVNALEIRLQEETNKAERAGKRYDDLLAQYEIRALAEGRLRVELAKLQATIVHQARSLAGQ